MARLPKQSSNTSNETLRGAFLSPLSPLSPPDKDEYFVVSGTGASTPVVAGTVALMPKRDPYLTPDDVKLRCQKYARSKYAWSKYAWSVVIDGQ